MLFQFLFGKGGFFSPNNVARGDSLNQDYRFTNKDPTRISDLQKRSHNRLSRISSQISQFTP